ncbi:MAG TPA: thiamine-phosphate kinase [Acidobacteriota bacterium]|nr:thiamine-phosphate kinase [Acidobacteriota bacterium]
MREFQLIDWIAQRRQEVPEGLLTGIGDDCAVFDPSFARRLLVTTDTLVEDVHFRRRWSSPAFLGHKALAVSLSDLGAMGARPHAALLSLCLPQDTGERWAHCLLEGLLQACSHWHCPLIGGNLAAASQVQITVTAWGYLEKGEAVLRSGGRAGEGLAVAGHLGLARRGLLSLRRHDPDLSAVEDGGELRQGKGDPRRGRLWEALLRPQPPLQAGCWLQSRELARSMIDLSDGLCADLGHLLRSSRLAAVLEERALNDFLRAQEPEEAADETEPRLQAALKGGEDYALLFSLDPQRVLELEQCPLPRGQHCGLIGHLEQGPPAIFLRDLRGKRRPLKISGYQHFGDGNA